MIEMSPLLKVDNTGKLLILDVRSEDGHVITPSKEWEEAVDFSFTISVVNDLYSAFLKSVSRCEENTDLPNSL